MFKRNHIIASLAAILAVGAVASTLAATPAFAADSDGGGDHTGGRQGRSDEMSFLLPQAPDLSQHERNIIGRAYIVDPDTGINEGGEYYDDGSVQHYVNGQPTEFIVRKFKPTPKKVAAKQGPKKVVGHAYVEDSATGNNQSAEYYDDGTSQHFVNGVPVDRPAR